MPFLTAEGEPLAEQFEHGHLGWRQPHVITRFEPVGQPPAAAAELCRAVPALHVHPRHDSRHS